MAVKRVRDQFLLYVDPDVRKIINQIDPGLRSHIINELIRHSTGKVDKDTKQILIALQELRQDIAELKAVQRKQPATTPTSTPEPLYKKQIGNIEDKDFGQWAQEMKRKGISKI